MRDYRSDETSSQCDHRDGPIEGGGGSAAFDAAWSGWVLPSAPHRGQTQDMDGGGESSVDRGTAGARGPVTMLLRRAREGDAAAERKLYEFVYDELRRRAQQAMRRQPREHTLQPTALVHEVFLKVARRRVPWADRAHFFATAACAMKQVLVDHAKEKNRAKRRADGARVPLDDVSVACEDRTYDVVALRDALDELATIDARAAEVVVLRFLSGLSNTDIAIRLGVTVKTVGRDWDFARAWLADRLDG